jgi:hypothetical protein
MFPNDIMIINWLLLHEHSYKDVRTFEAIKLRHEDLLNVSKVLEAIGPSLERLSLRFYIHLRHLGEPIVVKES